MRCLAVRQTHLAAWIVVLCAYALMAADPQVNGDPQPRDDAPGKKGEQDEFRVSVVDQADVPYTIQIPTTVSVGHKVTLKAKVEPAGLVGVTFQWTIPPTAVKNYEISDDEKTGIKTPLATADLQASSISFHWVDGADDRDVRVVATYKQKTDDQSARFHVKAPTLHSFGKQGALGTIAVRTANNQTRISTGEATPASQGISWAAKVTAHQNFGGKLRFTQIVRSKHTRTSLEDVVQKWTVPADWLDNHATYGGGLPWDIAAGETLPKAQLKATDTPASAPLEGGYKKYQIEQYEFRTFLMFRPTAPQSIWVPLGLIRWGWKGTAVIQNGVWIESTVAAEKFAWVPQIPVTTIQTVQFPQWPDRVLTVGQPEDFHPKWVTLTEQE